MSPKRPKNSKNNNHPDLLYPQELAKGMKPGEVKQIGESIYVIPVFVLEKPERTKKTRKAKK